MSDATNYAEDEIADWLGGNGAPSANSTPFVKLHLGAPGEDATGNAAAETTRIAVSFGAASGGVVTSDANVAWEDVSTTETYSHYSIWDAETDGNPLAVGALASSVSVTAGDNFTIPSGDLTVTVA
jgi:hypothetical protein